MSSEEELLHQELVTLRRGRALQGTDLKKRVGPVLWALSGVSTSDSTAIVRAKLVETLKKLSADLPSDLRYAVAAAFSFDPTNQHPVLNLRIEYFAMAQGISGRTARRRVDEAVTRLAQASAEHDRSGRPTQAYPASAELAANTGASYLDATVAGPTFDPLAVREFRKLLRPDVAVRLPDSLGPAGFLEGLGLLRGGKLTRSGILLFGENPSAVLPSAIVQCTQFSGTARDAPAERQDIQGTVWVQMLAARKFVADRVAEGSGAGSAAPTYRYSMVAVREVIANALVHRDYADYHRGVHVRLFDDRLEIASPGEWEGVQLPREESQELAALAGESRRRNFRLASVLASTRLVEGEGTGIPRAVNDSARLGAPSPLVVSKEGFVIVTLRPRRQPLPDRGSEAPG